VGSELSQAKDSRALRIAYADPPYPGCAHLYKDHPDYAGEVDHAALLHQLAAYDGWALSTSSKALQYVLSLCPDDVRVLVWVKNTVRYAWEPVIVKQARPADGLRDWIHCEPESFQWRPRPDSYVIGQKPEPFSMWVFGWLGADPDDDFTDLFPGSGAVGRAWDRFAAQTQLVPWTPANRRTVTRENAKSLRSHPTLAEPDAA
jgi:hypothetical protein